MLCVFWYVPLVICLLKGKERSHASSCQRYLSCACSLTVVVAWQLAIIALLLCIVLFSGFHQFNGNFVDARNNSEYRD